MNHETTIATIDRALNTSIDKLGVSPTPADSYRINVLRYFVTHLPETPQAALTAYRGRERIVSELMADSRFMVDPRGEVQNIYRLHIKKLAQDHVIEPKGRQLSQRMFGDEYSPERIQYLWQDLANFIFFHQDQAGIEVDETKVTISEDTFTGFLTDHFSIRPKEFQKEETPDQIAVRVEACKQAVVAERPNNPVRHVGYWPMTKDGESYQMDPEVFGWMVAGTFLADNYQIWKDKTIWDVDAAWTVPNQVTAGTVLSRLEQAGLLSGENFLKHEHVIRFVAERFLLDTVAREEFPELMVGMAQRVGVLESTPVLDHLMREFTACYPDLAEATTNPLVNGFFQSDVRMQGELQMVWQKLFEKRIEAILTLPVTDFATIWQHVFDQTDGKNALFDIYNRAEDKEAISPFYQNALTERKQIYGNLLFLAYAMGYPLDKARKLAAVAQFMWGVIREFGNLVHHHEEIKLRPTLIKTDGYPDAISKSMSALIHVLKEAFTDIGDPQLAFDLMVMFDTTFKKEREFRHAGWDKDISHDFKLSRWYNSAFSWFARFLGRKTGNPRAGERLLGYYLHFQTMLQVGGNDFEDLNPGIKHDQAGNDVGTRITPLLRAIVSLSDEVVPPEKKQLLKTVCEAERVRRMFPGRWRTDREQAQFDEALELCREHIHAAALVLTPDMDQEYRRAIACLNGGFGLLDKDLRNQSIKQFLLDNVNLARAMFYQLL